MVRLAMICALLLPAALAAGQEPLRLRVMGVAATNEGRAAPHMDPELRSWRSELERWDADTFRALPVGEATAPYGQETAIRLTALYTVYVTPLEVTENGEVLLQTRIVDTARGLDALRTRAIAAPGRALIFRGLELEGGELAAILLIASDRDDNGDSDDQGATPEDAEQDEEQPADADPDADEEEGDPAEPDGAEMEPGEDHGEADPADASPREGAEAQEMEEDPLEDMDHIDALLRALEEQDRRDQQERRRRQPPTQPHGGWW